MTIYLLKERVPCCFVTEKLFLTISATDILVPACSKIPLLYLLTQKVAQKFGYVLGIFRDERMKRFFYLISVERMINTLSFKK